MTLPARWNPLRYEGDARTGTLTIADLEQVRLDLSWQRARHPERVDLQKIRRHRRHPGVTWNPVVEHATDHPFLRARVGQEASGAMVAVLISRRSDRLLHVRCNPSPEFSPGPDDLPGLLDDLSHRPDVPWSVFGMTWSVPAFFRLKDLELTAGRLRFEFARGGERLLFERTLLRHGAPDAVRKTDSGWRHVGHALAVERTPLPVWQNLGRKALTISAEWNCPSSERRFRVVSMRAADEATLRHAVDGVHCHSR